MKYEVKIKESNGTCKTELFEKMAKKGDLTSTKINEIIGKVVKIDGYAICEISTEDNQFDIGYFDTEELGLISSGSQIFIESVLDYYNEVDFVRIQEIKTKRGKTYKAVPVIDKKTETKKDKQKIENEVNELPF